MITPWPDDYSWDIDHADSVRELIASNKVDLNSGVPSGTLIGDAGGQNAPGASFAGEWDGDTRIDYSIFHPPVPAKLPNVEKLRYVVRQPESLPSGIPVPVWSSPWPGIPLDFGEAPHRYSDHKPVVTSFLFTPLAVPGRFHPTWKHSVRQRIASADASDEDDCWGCKEVDLFTKMKWEKAAAGVLSSGSAEGSECKNNDHVTWGVDGCMGDWKHDDSHDGGITPPTYQYFVAALWDEDSTSANDQLLSAKWGQAIFWDVSAAALMNDNPRYPVDIWLKITDNAPIPHCAGQSGPGSYEPTNECYLTIPGELAPGQQF